MWNVYPKSNNGTATYHFRTIMIKCHWLSHRHHSSVRPPSDALVLSLSPSDANWKIQGFSGNSHSSFAWLPVAGWKNYPGWSAARCYLYRAYRICGQQFCPGKFHPLKIWNHGIWKRKAFDSAYLTSTVMVTKRSTEQESSILAIWHKTMDPVAALKQRGVKVQWTRLQGCDSLIWQLLGQSQTISPAWQIWSLVSHH